MAVASTRFTPDDELDLLFSEDLISAEVRNSLHPDFHIRPLASTDHARGHLRVLSTLTSSPDLGPAAWSTHFETLRARGRGQYYILVVIDKSTDQIAGVGTLLLELKFQRGMGFAGHMEDIVVEEKYQGKRLGLAIVQALTALSEKLGAYKTILDCRENNIAFYEKCGYERIGIQMKKYTLNDQHVPTHVDYDRLGLPQESDPYTKREGGQCI